MSQDAKLSGTREQVLTEIRTASNPPTVEEIATTLGLHRNSVRIHATALQEAGLATQTSRPTGGRGRPLTAYLPTSRGARAGGRNYQLLAEVLVDRIAATEDDPELAAREAGHSWGRRLVAGRHHMAEQFVPALLDELGFEPDHAESTITLHNCPFRELVDSHQGLVCSLHAGMLEGLADHGSPRVTLIPFTSPTTCTVRLGEQ